MITEIVVPDYIAARLAKQHGTLQAAERYYGLRIEAPSYPWTTGRLRAIADRVNTRLRLAPLYVLTAGDVAHAVNARGRQLAAERHGLG